MWFPWSDANRYPRSLPHSPGSPSSEGLSAQRTQAEHPGHTQYGAQGQAVSALSLLPCQTAVWWGGPWISATLRGLLKRNRIPKCCVGTVLFVGRKGTWGKVLIFNSNQWCRPLYSGKTTHPIFQWRCGLFILLDCPLPSPEKKEAAV